MLAVSYSYLPMRTSQLPEVSRFFVMRLIVFYDSFNVSDVSCFINVWQPQVHQRDNSSKVKHAQTHTYSVCTCQKINKTYKVYRIWLIYSSLHSITCIVANIVAVSACVYIIIYTDFLFVTLLVNFYCRFMRVAYLVSQHGWLCLCTRLNKRVTQTLMLFTDKNYIHVQSTVSRSSCVLRDIVISTLLADEKL